MVCDFSDHWGGFGKQPCAVVRVVSFGVLASKAVASSLTTHSSPQCLSACAYFGIVLSGLIQGADRREVLEESKK